MDISKEFEYILLKSILEKSDYFSRCYHLLKEKYFTISGNKEIFKMIKNNKLWTGYNMVKKFIQPDGSIKTFGNICWFTNLTTNKRNEEMVLTKNYNLIDYPKYENYEAIEVNRLANIPKDYDGVMGVPITFIDKYNPEQFEILGHTSSSDKSPEVEALRTDPNHRNRGLINGKEKYDRILIRRKK